MSTISINDILKDLDSARDKNVTSIWLPFAATNKSFMAIGGLQQKKIMQFSLDDKLVKPDLIQAISHMIRDNCKDLINIDNITMLDRSIICLCMREAFIKPTYVVKKNDLPVTVDLTKLIAANKDKVFPEELRTREVKSGEYTFTLAPYSIVKDYKYSSHLDSRLAALKITSHIMAEVYMYEVAKYITKINVRGNEIPASSLSVNDVLAILDKLPTDVIQEFIKYIEDLKKAEDEFLTIDGHTLVIDGTFFVAE